MNNINKELDKMKRMFNDLFVEDKIINTKMLKDHTVPENKEPEKEDLTFQKEVYKITEYERRTKELQEQREMIIKEALNSLEEYQKTLKPHKEKWVSGYSTWHKPQVAPNIPNYPAAFPYPKQDRRIHRVPRDVRITSDKEGRYLEWSVKNEWGEMHFEEKLPETWKPTDENVAKLIKNIEKWYDALISGISLETLMMEETL